MSWVPGPRYLLRRYCVLRVIRRLRPEHVLEVGCGAGDMLRCMAELGCQVVGVDQSAEARAEAEQRTASVREQVAIESELPGKSFDLVASFEVLEHIEDQTGALDAWVSRLRSGGRLLLSVPAHHRRWGPSDVWAGHMRRYERGDLTACLREAGLEVEHVWSLGFPLANWVEPIREALAKRRNLEESDMTARERTERSGIDRRWFERSLGLLVAGPLVRPFCWLQLLFLDQDLGNGYLALARRPGQ